LKVKGSPPLGKILDIGCGTGLFLEAINACGGGERIFFGVDISLSLLKLARHRLNDQSHLILADADFLPFPNKAFNTVVAFTLLQNVPDPTATLKEIKRVLMPLGTLVATYLKEKITLTGFKQLLKEAGIEGEPLSCNVSNEHLIVVWYVN
jgi:ubiquinone/menaquinone biosynthesis C-methylase UbiE